MRRVSVVCTVGFGDEAPRAKEVDLVPVPFGAPHPSVSTVVTWDVLPFVAEATTHHRFAVVLTKLRFSTQPTNREREQDTYKVLARHTADLAVELPVIICFGIGGLLGLRPHAFSGFRLCLRHIMFAFGRGTFGTLFRLLLRLWGRLLLLLLFLLPAK